MVRTVRVVTQRAARRRRTRKTSGKSRSVARQIREAAAGLGSYFGPIGSVVGRAAGGGISTLLGFGDYTVKENSLATASVTGQVPHLHIANESIVLRHRDYLGDLISSSTAGAFSVQSFALNPGLKLTCPWGSALAANFQEWKARGMVAEFHSESADALNSVNTALGSVMAVVQYNASASAPTTKVQMLNQTCAVEGKPSQSLLIPIECARSVTANNELYVRTGALAPNQDVKTYDLGNLYIATTGMQGTSVNLGSLWLSYEVELLKPIAVAQTGLTVPGAHYSLATPAIHSASQILTGLVNDGDNIGMVLSDMGVNFPAGATGDYLVYLVVASADSGFSGQVNINNVYNCTLVSDWSDVNATSFGTPNTSVVTAYGDANLYGSIYTCVVRIPNPSLRGSFTFGSATGTWGKTMSVGDLIITQISSTVF